MTSPVICAALCFASCMAIISDAEGKRLYRCNDEEIQICKDAAETGQHFVRCYKVQPGDCQITCKYTSPNQINSLNSPDYQECELGSHQGGACYKGICYWWWPREEEEEEENEEESV